MDPEKQAEKQIEVLLQESTHVHDNIQRNMNEMNKLLALAFPAVAAAFALVAEGKFVENTTPIYPVFCFLSSLLIVIFNNVWMQLLAFTQYKYVEVLPKLYQLTARPGVNFGQFAIRKGLLHAMIGPLILQMLLFPMAAMALLETSRNTAESLFRYPAYLAMILAVVTTVASWHIAWQGGAEVRNQRPVERREDPGQRRD